MDTLFVGKNIIFLPEINSTNSYAIDLLKNVNLSEGTVVHTANQTNGKGQRGSSWMATQSSNLTVSIILKPSFLQLKNQFYLYLIAALACYDTTAEFLDSSHIDTKIKWPNDILINRKKIAGILIENNLINDRINWCVVGIGINVNQTDFGGLNATSLLSELGKKIAVEDVLKSLCKNLEKHYLSLKYNNLTQLRAQYLQHLFGLEEKINFQIGDAVKSLCVKGIGDTGLLLLEDKNHQLSEYDVKEVKWLI